MMFGALAGTTSWANVSAPRLTELVVRVLHESVKVAFGLDCLLKAPIGMAMPVVTKPENRGVHVARTARTPFLRCDLSEIGELHSTVTCERQIARGKAY